MQSQNCTSCVCSSGGNAGLAAAYAARRLNIPISIIIPGSTPDFVAKRLEGEVSYNGIQTALSNQLVLFLRERRVTLNMFKCVS